ncbi:hypothetical protein NF716_00940 [Lactococcus formosensis]|uniref:hypothetical protein n=1 Tax=Lactococcus formosensis TaxID=1281486 RepID=UPI0024352D3A|nr:hypothetical protein [Lactococcus formosensis]MDG6154929.1 hypothetical protein [Lactococcus formosensis]
MNKADWIPYRVTGKLTKVRNRNVNAVLITRENALELKKEFPFIELFGENTLLTGFMSFMSLPVYLVNINPRQPLEKRYYMFKSQYDFEHNTTELERDEDE